MVSSPGPTLPEQVASKILNRIMRGELPVGQAFPPERVIQETYNISRPMAREAIKLLAARGVLTTTPSQGTIVASDLTTPAIEALMLAFHRRDVYSEDLLATRFLLEPPIAAMAARHATPIQIRRLQQQIELMEELSQAEQDQAHEADEAAAEQRRRRWGAADIDFHVLLAEVAQNPVLHILIETLVGIIWRVNRPARRSGPPLLQSATAQHRAIFDAVAAHDSARAEQLMREHLEFTHQNMVGEGQLRRPIETIFNHADE